MTDNKGNLKRNLIIASVLVITLAFVSFLVVADVAAPGVTMNQRNATLTYVNINGTDNSNLSIMEIEVVSMNGVGTENFWNFTYIHANVTGVPNTNVEYVTGVYYYNGTGCQFISDNITTSGLNYTGIWDATNNTNLNMSQCAKDGNAGDTGLMPEAAAAHNFTMNITVSSSIPTGSIINITVLNYTNGSDTNLTPNYGHSVAWRNVYAGIIKIDNMGPTITVDSPATNATTASGNLSGYPINVTIIDNMSAYDSGAGVANATVMVALSNKGGCADGDATFYYIRDGTNSSADYEATYRTMNNVTANSWNDSSVSINIHSFSDGDYYLCVYAGDLTGVYQPTGGVNNSGYSNDTMLSFYTHPSPRGGDKSVDYVNLNSSTTNISILEFQCIGTAVEGGALNSTTLKIAISDVSHPGKNTTNPNYVPVVYVYNSTTVYQTNDSMMWNASNYTQIRLNTHISSNAFTNFTVNITLNSTVPEGAVINVSVVNITNSSDVNCTGYGLPVPSVDTSAINITDNATIIDNMAPTITLDYPANTTNSTDPAQHVNVTIADAGSGIANGSVWFALTNGSACSDNWFNPDNASNFTSVSWDDVAVRMHNLTASGWNATINTTSFTNSRMPEVTDGTFTNLDGSYYICVYTYDTVDQPTSYKNYGYSNSTMITIDNTNPTMVITLSSSGLIVGESTTISCACSDSISNCTSQTTSITITKPNGDNITSHTSGTAYSPGTTGTYTVTCAGITDYAANTGDTGTSTFSVSASGSSGDGGGGGGGVPVATGKVTWTALNPGETTTQEFDEDIGIPEIEITVSEKRANVKLEVSKLSGIPEGVTAPAGDDYTYLEITHTNLEDEYITEASITFAVDNTWLAEHDIDLSTVALNRYVDGAWVALETELLEEGGMTTTFKAKTPGFSYFAVTGLGPEEGVDKGLAAYWIWIIIGAVLVVAAILYFATKKMGQ